MTAHPVPPPSGRAETRRPNATLTTQRPLPLHLGDPRRDPRRRPAGPGPRRPHRASGGQPARRCGLELSLGRAECSEALRDALLALAIQAHANEVALVDLGLKTCTARRNDLRGVN